MAETERRGSLRRRLAEDLRWKGALGAASEHVRRTAAGVIALMSLTCIAVQWGFVGVMFSDGTTSYLMFMLVPVALAVVMFGTLEGAGMGLLTGAILFAHSKLMPLDYYELTYVTPISSVFMTAVCALVLGVLCARIKRAGLRGRRRVLALATSCLLTSLVFSLGFAVNAALVTLARGIAQGGISATGIAQATSQAARAAVGTVSWEPRVVVESLAVGVFGDALIMLVATSGGIVASERGMLKSADSGLRTIFGVRLSVVVLAAFLVVTLMGHTAVSASSLAQAHNDMASEISYLLGQAERQAGTSVGGGLQGLLRGYGEAEDGLTVLVSSGRVAAVDAIRLSVGGDLDTIFDEGVLAAIARSEGNGTIERVVYLAPNEFNDLVWVGGVDSSGLSAQVGYLVAIRQGAYEAIMIQPTNMVFSRRDAIVAWVALSSFVLLAASLAIAWQMLDAMVAKRIDATNAVLARIVEGDLEARVVPEGTLEFWDLAAGINVTVDAMQGLIREAETRMEAELATAKAIQASALPGVFPPYPDIQRFDIYASMNAAKEVGGDFYDFFLVGDDCGPDAGRLAFVMADVSGKGVPAALFMMKAKTQIRDYLESGMELGEAIENANRQLCDGNDAGMFVTVWVGVLDYATRHIEYVNAGHNPPLLWQDGRWSWLRQRSGLPLGLFDGMPYKTHAIDCEVGDQILLYTDGVTEAFSASEEQYGEDRLERLVNEGFDLHPRELVDRVRASVAEHARGAEQSDDITILALEVGVPPEEKSQIVVPAELDQLKAVNEFIHTELERRLAPMRAQLQLDIAVEEMFVNSCTYAYEGMGAEVERYVRVTCAYSANPVSLTVEIVDGGVPFDPLAKPEATKASDYDSLMDIPIGGLGILMTKKNVDEMRYERVGDTNVVTLVKRW